MAPNENGVPAITDPWPVKDIVYISIIGPVMCAAFLEWFLFLAAFLYCLIKVFQKAEHWTIRLLAVLLMIVFIALRGVFLPVMIVTLPLPAQVTRYFPEAMVTALQWFAFYTFAGLLTIPWLFCIYQLVTKSLGRTKRIKHLLDDVSAPKTVVVMPVYKEDPDILVTAINSVVACDYPAACLHVFLSFDGDQEDELYLKTIENLGVPLTLDTYPRSIDVQYKGARITVSRFPHGGKRKCQKSTFKLIDKIYTEYLKRNDNLFILFIDSDCILDDVCIQNFMYEMELKPGSKQNMLAMTGVITATTEKKSFITLLQDMEYIHGQLFERSVESGCGAVTCLPGALTMLRFSAFRKMAKYYFADKAEQCDDLFDYGKCHLGEDRWLTHLFMIGAKERYQIQMNTGAFCKTEAVQTYRSLLKQRRRWFLGYITNEACMLTDIRLWKRYPLLCFVRLMQNTIRTTALLFFIMVISIMSTQQSISNLPVGFIAVSLGLNWLLMIYFGAKLRRFKIWLYPLMFVVNPFFNWCYMVYGIFTAGQRTWGGPRADAGAADSNTTPQQAIEKAEADGDDLNVVPETFKPAAQAAHAEKPQTSAPLFPSDHVDGRFAVPERLPGGWYSHSNDSGLTLPNMFPRNPNAPRIPLHPRDSFDSFVTTDSRITSVYMPRRVESFMGDEDQRKYQIIQQAQAQGSGAQSQDRHQGTHDSFYGSPYGSPYLPPQKGRVYDLPDEADSKTEWEVLEHGVSNAGTPRSGRSGTYSPRMARRSYGDLREGSPPPSTSQAGQPPRSRGGVGMAEDGIEMDERAPPGAGYAGVGEAYNARDPTQRAPLVRDYPMDDGSHPMQSPPEASYQPTRGSGYNEPRTYQPVSSTPQSPGTPYGAAYSQQGSGYHSPQAHTPGHRTPTTRAQQFHHPQTSTQRHSSNTPQRDYFEGVPVDMEAAPAPREPERAHQQPVRHQRSSSYADAGAQTEGGEDEIETSRGRKKLRKGRK